MLTRLSRLCDIVALRQPNHIHAATKLGGHWDYPPPPPPPQKSKQLILTGTFYNFPVPNLYRVLGFPVPNWERVLVLNLAFELGTQCTY